MKPGIPVTKELRDKIRRDYLLGDFTNEVIADKYGVHTNTVYNLSQRENWEQLKELILLKGQIVILGEQLLKVIQERIAKGSTVPTQVPVAQQPTVETTKQQEKTDAPLSWSF